MADGKESLVNQYRTFIDIPPEQLSVVQLQIVNQYLKESRLCAYCNKNPGKHLPLPCADSLYCVTCSNELWPRDNKTKPAKCPNCKSIVRGIANIYFA